MFIELDDLSIRDALLKPFVAGVPNYVVIPTNEQNIHGAGLALIIRKAFPQLEALSRKAGYDNDAFASSQYLHTARTSDPFINIVLVPTKESPKDRYASLAMIARQMLLIKSIILDDGVIVMPKIGCGLGGLKWNETVGPLVHHILGSDNAFTNVIIATKRMEIETIEPGFNKDLHAMDYTVQSMDGTLGVPDINWFGFTDYGALSHLHVVVNNDLVHDPELAFTLLKSRSVVVNKQGSWRATDEFVMKLLSKRYAFGPYGMWNMLYEPQEEASPPVVNS